MYSLTSRADMLTPINNISYKRSQAASKSKKLKCNSINALKFVTKKGKI